MFNQIKCVLKFIRNMSETSQILHTFRNSSRRGHFFTSRDSTPRFIKKRHVCNRNVCNNNIIIEFVSLYLKKFWESSNYNRFWKLFLTSHFLKNFAFFRFTFIIYLVITIFILFMQLKIVSHNYKFIIELYAIIIRDNVYII